MIVTIIGKVPLSFKITLIIRYFLLFYTPYWSRVEL